MPEIQDVRMQIQNSLMNESQSNSIKHFHQLTSLLWPLLLSIVTSVLVSALESQRALWWDEAHTYWLATGTVNDVIAKCNSELYPPLYFVLQNRILQLIGSEEWKMRLLPCMFAVLTVIPVYLSGKRLGGSSVGMCAGMIAATSPILNFYCTEARPYTCLVFCLSCAMLYFIEVLQAPKRWLAKLLFMLSLTASLYTHHFAIFFLPAPAISVIWRKDISLKLIVQILGLTTSAFLIYLPSFLTLLNERSGGENWISMLWTNKALLLAPLESMDFLVFGVGNTPNARPTTSWPLYPGVATFCLIGVALLLCWRTLERAKLLTFCSLLLLSVIPLTIPLAYSVLVKPIYVIGRYDLIGFPPVPVLLALLFAQLAASRHTRICAIGYSSLILSSLIIIGFNANASLTKRSNQDFQSTLLLQDLLNKGDGVVCVGLRFVTMDYYFLRLGSDIERTPFPAAMKKHPGIYFNAVNQQPETIQQEAFEIRQRIATTLKSNKKVIIAGFQSITETSTASILNALQGEFNVKPLGDQNLNLFTVEPR